MAAQVIKLVSNAKPRPKACLTCAFYHPNTNAHGTERVGWFKPRVPSADAHRFAICSFEGGHFASAFRSTKCKGEMWEMRENNA